MNNLDDQQIFKLKNQIQNYSWGSNTFIQQLLGNDNASREPQAELWMGSHLQASSQVIMNGKEKSLREVILSNPEEMVGVEISCKFNNNLPFLFKVLAAAKPLSIQAHPGKQQAEKGFLKENTDNIPINSRIRNYKDDNHKPELIFALTDFELMCGFQPIAEIIERIDYLKLEETIPEINDLRKAALENNLKGLYSKLMSITSNRDKYVLELKKRIENFKPRNEHDKLISKWISKLADVYPNDMGVFSPLLLNIIQLKHGEALFIEDGILHSYLSGSGLEVMANSDNVLRGGLTSKNVDIPELLQILKFDVQDIKTIQPDINNNETFFRTPAQEFQLSRIEIIEQQPQINSEIKSPEIMLCTAGSGKIFWNNSVLEMKKGESIFIPFSISEYTIEGNLEIFRVSVPF